MPGTWTCGPGSATATTARCSTTRPWPSAPVGRGTYQWDGAAGTWFWVDPEHDLLYVGMIQLLSYAAPPLQKITQALIAEALLDR